MQWNRTGKMCCEVHVFCCIACAYPPRMAIVLCRSDVFCVSKKTRVHILTRRSKYEQGGSWNNNANNCVVGIRNNNNPDNSNDNLGLRLAMSKNWRPCQFLDASFGSLRLPKRRYCVEPPPSVAVLRAHTNGVNRPWWKMYIRVLLYRCTSLYIGRGQVL